MPNEHGMARLLRATCLITLGVAASVLPAGIAVAANTGGAAPESMVAASSSASGGASVATPSPSAPKGAAAPGDPPAQKSTSKKAGGAVPGKRPRRKVVKRQPKPPVKVKKKVKKKPVVTPPVPIPTPAPTAPVVPPAPASPNVAGVFPLTGTFTFGADDARFGAGRPGHIHQGQDVIADSGTPIVAPVSGSVLWKANQEGAAGIYLVVHGSDGRDYVFMHIKSGTVQVEVGDTVIAGQQLAQVGATGAATGPHLHFEIWVGGWYVKGGVPIDPLPQLQSWAGL